jgi:hypothetical protein
MKKPTQVLSISTTGLETASKFVHSAIANSSIVNKRLLTNFIPALAICFELPTAVRGGAEFLKAHRMVDGQIFSENLGANIFNKGISK